MEIKNSGGIKNIVSRYRMLWRLLLTVFMLICLPTMIVNWLALGNIYARTERQNRELQAGNARRLAEYFSIQQNEMLRIIYDMEFDSELMPNTISAHRYNVIPAISCVNRYSRMLPLASAVYVYYRNGRYVLGPSSQFHRAFFTNSFTARYSGSERFEESVAEALDANDNRVRYIAIDNPRNSLRNGMLVCLPGRLRSDLDTVVMFHINSSSLASAYFGQSGNDGVEMLIFEGETLLVTTAGETRLGDSEEFVELMRTEGSANADVKCGEEAFYVTKVYDAATGLSFVVSAPLEHVTGAESDIRDIINKMTLITAVMLIMLAAVTVYINYRPIMEAMNRIAPGREGRGEKGEITTIMDTLDDVITINEEMSRTISERDMMVSDFVMQRLLAGKSVSDKDLEIVRLSRRDTDFFIITIVAEINSALTADIREQLLISLSEGYSCRAIMTQSFFEGQTILLIAAGDARRPEVSGCVAKEVLDFIGDSGVKKLKLGVGTVESKLENIRSSYLSSLIAADQGEDHSVSFYEQAVQNFSSFENYPSEKVLLFLQYVKQGNTESARQALDGIFEHIAGNISSWMLERFVYNDIVNMFVKTVNKLGYPIENDAIAKLMAFSNSEDLKMQMAELTTCVCEEVRRERDTTDKQISEAVIEYVNANCLNQDISLEMAADNFEMSIYTFSTLFKKTVGSGFREYIVKRRLDCAKELILTTDMTVKSVAAQVGFGDVSYFIRVFKNNFGVTPTQMKSRQHATGSEQRQQE